MAKGILGSIFDKISNKTESNGNIEDKKNLQKEEKDLIKREPLEITPAVIDNARLILLDILKTMQLSVEVASRENTDNVIDLEITGEEDLGLVIGKEGNTLKSLQFLLSTILSKKYEKKVFVKLDANDYKAKQEQAVIAAANDAADVAEKENVQIILDPMSAAERRHVHMVLQDRANIETFSRGERGRRQVVVSPKGFQKDNGGNTAE
jgi:spoIIIJ-associated protein